MIRNDQNDKEWKKKWFKSFTLGDSDVVDLV